jgi:hypothetical protein
MMAHLGHHNPISLQVLSPQSLPSTLLALLRQSLRLTRTNEPTSKRSAAGRTKELLKAWGHSSLIWTLAVLGTSQRDSELATEPGSKLSDQAVTPSATSITIGELPELQQQLQNVLSDLAALQRLVEQVASKQEQISRDMTTLQAAEQNLGAKISSFAQPAAVRVAPRRNVTKLVHSEASKQPTAESQPLQPPAPEIPSPTDQPPRPPLR